MGQWPLIFLLEDDEDIQAYNMDLLIASRYVPMCAGTLAEARRLLEGHIHPRLYLLDGKLPDGTGVEFCRELREKGVTAPIMFLSGEDDAQSIERGLAAGADYYMTKPYDPKRLTQEIATLLERNGVTE